MQRRPERERGRDLYEIWTTSYAVETKLIISCFHLWDLEEFTSLFVRNTKEEIVCKLWQKVKSFVNLKVFFLGY